MPTLTGLSPRQQQLLAATHARDLASLAVLDLLGADATGEAPTDAVLAVDAAMPTGDRRALWATARVLPHLPSLRTAVEHGRCSFALAARVCRHATTHRLTEAHLAQLDPLLDQLLADRRDADDLADRVVDHVVALKPDVAEAWEERSVDRVTYLPDLFGGGAIDVQATATTYPLLTGAIDHVMTRDDLLDRADLQPDTDDAAAAHNHATIAEARAAALTSMAADVLAGHSRAHTDAAVPSTAVGSQPAQADAAPEPRTSPRVAAESPPGTTRATVPGRSDAVDGQAEATSSLPAAERARATSRSARGAADRRRPRPSMQVVVPVDVLTGDTDEPARLLTGGRLTAATTRRLADAGVDLTAIVVDHDGDVLGVGRRTRTAPGWLDRLTRALQPRCVVPGCRRRVTDLDHATRWTDAGATDLPNLARLCRRHHVAKDTDHAWHLQPTSSGTVTVTHVDSGWTTTTRPPGTGPPPPDRTAATDARRARQPRLPLPPSTGPPGPTATPVTDGLPF